MKSHIINNNNTNKEKNLKNNTVAHKVNNDKIDRDVTSQISSSHHLMNTNINTVNISNIETGSNMSSNSNCNINSPKMGSRRIFTPQFKLQVLESYRSDSDCKGNQRATARKYNIHRRQIQKWLQCESNLRSSVTNLNQNNIKHQFHNITRPLHHQHPHQTHEQQEQQHQQMQLHNQSLPVGTSKGHSFYVPQQKLSMENNIQASVEVKNTTTNNEVYTGLMAGPTRDIVVATTPTTSSTTNASTAPLRPTAINGVTNISTHTRNLPVMHHPHHYSSMVYRPNAATAVVAAAVNVPFSSIPLLTHTISQQHLHHTYQYHPPPPPAPHIQTLQPLPEQNQKTFSIPSPLCLPTTSSAVLNGSAIDISKRWIEDTCPTTDYIYDSQELHSPAEHSTEMFENNEILLHNYNNYQSNKDANNYLGMHYTNMENSYLAIAAPIDLSLGSRRENRKDVDAPITYKGLEFKDSGTRNFETLRKENPTHIKNNDNDLVVDLTFRKRKAFTLTNDFNTLELYHEKVAKLSKITTVDNNDTAHNIVGNSIEHKEPQKNNDVEPDVEEDVVVDVEDECKLDKPPLKPIKLFKPYLPDNGDDEDDENFDKDNKLKCLKSDNEEFLNEQRAPIIWSNHPECLSPQSYDSRQCSSRDSYFQSPPHTEKYPFQMRTSTPAQSPKNELFQSNCGRNISPCNSKPLVPPSTFCSPKGSPVSGYESSSSTYSENSYGSENNETLTLNKTYRFDLKMRRVSHENIMEQQSHIERWLNQDTKSEKSASIVLYT